MKINLFKNSWVVNNLFINSVDKKIKESKILELFQYKNTKLSFFLGIIALVVSWYEPMFKIMLPGNVVDILPFILLFFALIFADKSKIKIYKVHYWYIGFLLISICSSFLAVIRGEAGLNAPMYIMLIILFFIAFIWAQAQSTIKLLNSLLFSSLPLAIYGIWQYFSGNVVFTTSSLESIYGRASAFFTSPNVFGMLMVLMVLICLSIFKDKKDIKYIIIMLVFITASFVSLSRTAWVAGLFGILPFISINYFKNKISNLAFFTGLKSRILVIFNPEYWLNASIDGRIWSFKNGLYILKNHPFIGTGAGTYGGKFAEMYSSPIYFLGMQNGYVPLLTTDNQYIAFLIQFGILGFLTFLGFLISVIFQVSFIKNNYKYLLYSSMLAFSFMMFASNTFEFLAISIPVAIIFGNSLGENS